jgi:hypothetical protein
VVFCGDQRAGIACFESGSMLKQTGEYFFSKIGLEKLISPSSVEVIREGCFSDCDSPELLMFETESNLKRIERFAFDGMLLSEVKFPNSVRFIDGRARPKLPKFVLFHPCPTNFRVRGVMLEDTSGSALIRCLGHPVSLVMPQLIETIGDGYFMENETLESIAFEADSGLRRIGEEAFV